MNERKNRHLGYSRGYSDFEDGCHSLRWFSYEPLFLGPGTAGSRRCSNVRYARSQTPGTRRTGAALAGNPVAEAWCSCRWMAGGQSLKGSRLSWARGRRLDRGSTSGIDPPLLLVLGSPTSRRRLSSGRKEFRRDDCYSIERI
ncbi:UDP-N-acetylmuramoylalanine--D-glutamate ligase [Striga asiatica]|uniref:UDP-N-acetylmuramoylalanine--D-glutamate ligase n=1 Tax=Striga asiatica TaxID=4170 RepID=A0A5A7R677_STRAF|nr:UDP-N-acetylmuramoylalanine--D-glutamate ligase [Striga asiatica]